MEKSEHFKIGQSMILQLTAEQDEIPRPIIMNIYSQHFLSHKDDTVIKTKHQNRRLQTKRLKERHYLEV